MNIFVLDECPMQSARWLCDKHIVKMPLESAQMLSTAHRVIDGDEYADQVKLYKAAYINHPCSKWCRESKMNYRWLYAHFRTLVEEYEDRYQRTHGCRVLLGPLARIPSGIQAIDLTPPPQAMPQPLRIADNPVNAYRNYYLAEKSRIAKWERNPTRIPPWFCHQ
jgi:hypothetical protein